MGLFDGGNKKAYVERTSYGKRIHLKTQSGKIVYFHIRTQPSKIKVI